MSQSRKHRGYATQRIVAEYLQSQGWDNALPVGAGRDGSDITGIKGLDIEIKARTKLDLAGTMRQLQERSKDTGLGIGVLRLNGQVRNPSSNSLHFSPWQTWCICSRQVAID